MIRHRRITFSALLLAPLILAAQTSDIARDRAEFSRWLTTAPSSPFAAVALQAIGGGISIGPADSDVPLENVGLIRLTESSGVVRLASPGSSRVVPRNRDIPIGAYRLVVAGEPGRSVALVYGVVRQSRAPAFYRIDPAFAVTGTLAAAPAPRTQRILGYDGIEVEASDAGMFRGRLFSDSMSLTVLRVSDPGSEESELLVYFRDATSGAGSYPAGRFATLERAANGRYRLDLNRARNPFCAYSSVYPCPAPWPGNTLTMAVTAGEQYAPAPHPAGR